MQIRRLNALRGLAALIVVVAHYSNHAQLWGALLGTRAGQIGVMLFFLLSAFLMTLLYLDREPTPMAVRGYARARIARVVPLYVAVVVGSWICQQVGWPLLTAAAYDIPGLKSLASHLLLLYGVQILWTIPAEIHFYVIFAALWWLRPRVPLVVPGFCAVVLLVFLSGHWPLGPKQPVLGFPIDLPLLRGLPYFAVGMLMGLLHHRWRCPRRLQSHAYALTLFGILLVYPAILQALTGWTHQMWFDPAVLAAMSAIFFAIVFMVPEGNRVLENPVADHLGKISYSMYLLHFPLLLLLKQLGAVKGEAGLLMFLTSTLLLATLSYRFFEVPTRTRIRAGGPTLRHDPPTSGFGT